MIGGVLLAQALTNKLMQKNLEKAWLNKRYSRLMVIRADLA